MKKMRPRTEEVQRLVHELPVQQLELERQTRRSGSARHELEAERDRVADLYQLAPVAHLTLDRMGTVVEATVLAVALLGVDYGRLTRRRLHERVVPADWVTLSRHHRRLCGRRAADMRPRDPHGSRHRAIGPGEQRRGAGCRRAVDLGAGRPSWTSPSASRPKRDSRTVGPSSRASSPRPWTPS